MSTRNQRRKNTYQENTENVGETIVSPILLDNFDLDEQDIVERPKSASYLSLKRTSNFKYSLLQYPENSKFALIIRALWDFFTVQR